jgi:hypothetical protein
MSTATSTQRTAPSESGSRPGSGPGPIFDAGSSRPASDPATSSISSPTPFAPVALGQWSADFAICLAPIGQLRQRLARAIGESGFDLSPEATAATRAALMLQSGALDAPEREALGAILDRAFAEAAQIRAGKVEAERREAERRESAERFRAERAEAERRRAEDARMRQYEADQARYAAWQAGEAQAADEAETARWEQWKRQEADYERWRARKARETAES